MSKHNKKAKAVKSSDNIAANVQPKFSTTGVIEKSVGAKRQANKVLKALEEVNEMHAGRKKGKSFDQFLKEI